MYHSPATLAIPETISIVSKSTKCYHIIAAILTAAAVMTMVLHLPPTAYRATDVAVSMATSDGR